MMRYGFRQSLARFKSLDSFFSMRTAKNLLYPKRETRQYLVRAILRLNEACYVHK